MIIEIDDENGRELLSQLHEQGVDARIIKQEQCERCESVRLANIDCVDWYNQIKAERDQLGLKLREAELNNGLQKIEIENRGCLLESCEKALRERDAERDQLAKDAGRWRYVRDNLNGSAWRDDDTALVGIRIPKKTGTCAFDDDPYTVTAFIDAALLATQPEVK